MLRVVGASTPQRRLPLLCSLRDRSGAASPSWPLPALPLTTSRNRAVPLQS